MRYSNANAELRGPGLRRLPQRVAWTTGAVAALVMLGGGALGDGALGSAVGCGTVLTSDTVLTADLACTGDGLVIGRSGIHLDLGGHTISGTAAAGTVGIRNAGFDRVTISNGTVGGFLPGFDVGIALTGGANDNRLSGLTVSSNTTDGIAISGSRANLAEGSVVQGNGVHGIALRDATGNVVRGNIVNGTNPNALPSPDAANIALIDSARNRVIGNDASVSSSFTAGILLSAADDNVIAGNMAGGLTADGNGGYGIALVSGSDGNDVGRNTAANNGLSGMLVQAGSSGNRLARNVASRNLDDGIHVDAAATSLVRNRADDNGDLGIEAVPGVVGRGNEAHGNGNPAQCLNVVCT